MSSIKLGALYSIARSYALRGMLLEFSQYEDLARSKNLEEIIDRLRPTVYGETLTEIPKPLNSENLEKLFERNLIDIEYSLIRYIPKARFLETYFLRHVYKNLKIVLKSKTQTTVSEELYSKMNLRAEEHLKIRDLVVKVLAEKDLESSIKALEGTPMYKDLVFALELYNKEKDPLIFDTSLDRSFYEQILQALRKMKKDERPPLQRLIAYEIDSYIITTALRSRFWNLTPAETRRFMISSGIKLNSSKVENLVKATKVDEVLRELEDTDYQRIVKMLDPSQILKTIIDVENWFKEELIKEVGRTFLKNIFKQAVVYSFIKLKELEVRNLSAISFGVEYGLSSSEILENVRKVV
ncbi:MAG: V-type ATPase subunit [Aigarchaeota archaeon]|nr:V-type ATPase subunit [Aigarchaeota archaeon]MCX8193316.1 V-type ATPase subunit [Nitrososphaeria archaeon]MDW7986535.1 V-type ATPase subunit [Nitrososphaerota archaeon]